MALMSPLPLLEAFSSPGASAERTVPLPPDSLKTGKFGRRVFNASTAFTLQARRACFKSENRRLISSQQYAHRLLRCTTWKQLQNGPNVVSIQLMHSCGHSLNQSAALPAAVVHRLPVCSVQITLGRGFTQSKNSLLPKVAQLGKHLVS